MIDISLISGESPLLDEKTAETMRGIFQKLDKAVVLKAAVDPEEEKSAEMASFLKGIAGLSPMISLELYSRKEADILAQETREQGAQIDISHLPVTGIFVEGVYQRAAFHGVPGGKEINSFVIGIYNAAGPGQEIFKAAIKKIGRLKRPADVKICVSLACHHCPGVVIASQRIAMLSPLVQAQMYDANLYPDLVEKYQIERVPLVIINNSQVYAGPRSIEDLTQLLLDAR